MRRACFGMSVTKLRKREAEGMMDANRSLTITLHEICLALAKTPIEGPAGLEASFDFRSVFNLTAQRMMTVVIRKQQLRTEYA